MVEGVRGYDRLGKRDCVQRLVLRVDDFKLVQEPGVELDLVNEYGMQLGCFLGLVLRHGQRLHQNRRPAA